MQEEITLESLFHTAKKHLSKMKNAKPPAKESPQKAWTNPENWIFRRHVLGVSQEGEALGVFACLEHDKMEGTYRFIRATVEDFANLDTMQIAVSYPPARTVTRIVRTAILPLEMPLLGGLPCMGEVSAIFRYEKLSEVNLENTLDVQTENGFITLAEGTDILPVLSPATILNIEKLL